MESQIITGIFTLLGAGVPILASWLHDKGQYRIEKMKLHEMARLAAYKRLGIFGKYLSRNVYPLASDKESSFEGAMKKFYFDKIEGDFVYFSSRINEILERFESIYTCIGNTELISETEDSVMDYLDNHLFDRAEELIKESKKEVFSYDNS